MSERKHLQEIYGEEDTDNYRDLFDVIKGGALVLDTDVANNTKDKR